MVWERPVDNVGHFCGREPQWEERLVTLLPSPSTTSPSSSSSTLAAVREDVIYMYSGHRQATGHFGSASSLRPGALSDYRQHDLTEGE